MMKKVLMVASVPSMIGQFNMSNIVLLKEMGFKVDIACNFKDNSVWDRKKITIFIRMLIEKDIKYYQIDFSRNINKLFQHVNSYRQLKKILAKNNYEFIHCHTPIGSVITRLVGRKHRSKGTKIIYTAHGFHFYKGAPLKNWILYYPVERFLSKYTDALITINSDDYKCAKSFYSKKVYYIPGVGFDTRKFTLCSNEYRDFMRKELNIPLDAIVCLSVGELNNNKNHAVVIRALKYLMDKKIYYIICGRGEGKIYLKKLCDELGVSNNVKLLGYRKDINYICKMSDIYVFPSKREGLGISALEGMASGLPLVSSRANGVKEYAKDGLTGYCRDSNDIEGFAEAIKILAEDNNKRKVMGEYNKRIVKKFDIDNVNKKMNKIYSEIDRSN